MGLLISHEICWISCGFHEIQQISGEIHPKPCKSRCFNHTYPVWWMQERDYDPGFHEIWGHSPLHAPPPPNWRVFVETSDFIRFWVDFMKSTRFHGFHEICQISMVKSARFQWWNPPDFNGEIHQISRISKLWAFAWWSSIGLLIFERPNIIC